MERIFGNPLTDPSQSDLLTNLRADLSEYKDLIKRVLVHLVFKGDIDATENSEGLQGRRENVENKKYLVEHFFGNEDVELRVEFIADTRRAPPPPPPHAFALAFAKGVSVTTSDGERTMHVGFIPLLDLYRVYQKLGQRFFDRNIRSGLSSDNPPNRKIREALTDIVLRKRLTPDVFPFNHNGVTLAAEHMTLGDQTCSVKVPRLLNGAQTITSLAKFMEENEGNPALTDPASPLGAIRVLAKIIVDDPSSDFVANVTICNNRQNPVEPWNLRANDRIQCDLHDRLREEVGIFYSRQENAFQNFSVEELEELGYDASKDIRIRPLAQTFLAAQGEIARMSQLPEVFENQKWYEETFKESYLRCDARRIVLAYKVHLLLKSPMERLDERAAQRIGYAISRARNLVWTLLIQGIFNSGDLPDLLDAYGNGLTKEADLRVYLMDLASGKLLPILRELLSDKTYEDKMASERYDFLRTKDVFRRCMDLAADKFDWTKKSL